jgi:hypothetical protein
VALTNFLWNYLSYASSVSNPHTLPFFSLSLNPLSGLLSPGLTLSQLLDEVQEDQEHRGALVRLAESCLVLAGSCTATPLTHWAASHCKATVSLGFPLGGIKKLGKGQAETSVSHRKKPCILSPAYCCTSLRMTSKF